MKKIFSILLIVCSFSRETEAQNVAATLPNIQMPFQTTTGGDLLFNTLIDGVYISGTPYLTNEWQKGVVLLKNGTTYDNYMLKYDTYKQLLIFLNGKDVMEVADPIKEFILDGKDGSRYHFINAEEYHKADKPLFYEILVEAKKGHLLKAHHKSIVTGDRVINSVVQQELAPHDDYFYYDAATGKVTPLKFSAGSIEKALKLTPDEESTLFFSARHFNNESDLIEFFNLYLSPENLQPGIRN